MRETIRAAVQALGDSQITPDEMAIKTGERQRNDTIRLAPSYSGGQNVAGDTLPPNSYTVDALAKFLGEVGSDGHAHDGFKNAFAVLELIS
jgi:hypothetical protein